MTLRGIALVANTGDDTLTYVKLTNKTKIETIDLKGTAKKNNRNFKLNGPCIGPYEMASNREGIVYCTNAYQNSIFKIDIKNREIVDMLYVGSYPTSIKYFEDHLYITNSDSNSVSIIDEKSFSLIENIPVGERPIDIEIDEINMQMYVANSNGCSINIIDLLGKDNRSIKFTNNPAKIILEGENLYILFNVNNNVINNSNISIMDINTYAKKAIVDLNGLFTNMLKINGSEIIFLTNMDNGYLFRMDIKKRHLLNKIYLTGMPNKLKWDGDNIVFISNILNNTLSLFHINENKIIDNIKVGLEPNGILILD